MRYSENGKCILDHQQQELAATINVEMKPHLSLANSLSLQGRTLEINTGDSPPITQKPYTLPLKHATWVQKELEILEKAGVIVRSVSPWASPIVVVPKRTAPGEAS